MGPEYASCWPWAGMWLFPVMMCAVIMVVVFLLMRRGACRTPCCGPSRQQTEDAQNILKQRYAKGEITKTEFEQMKREILRQIIS